MFSSHRRLFLQSTSLLLAGGATHSLLARTNGAAPQFAENPTFKPTALFLTWQRDPTTTMTVQWVGTEQEGAARPIWYRKSGADEWRVREAAVRPYPLMEKKIFRAELTGLDPDSIYRFRVGLDSPQEWFRTMPAKATRTIQFVSGGDSGVGSAAERTNRLAAVQNPEFIMLGGDLAYENGKDAGRFLKFLDNYARAARDSEGRAIPLLACIGNHEVDGHYGKTRKAAPFFYAFFDGLYSETGYAALDFGDYLSLVMLDTNHTSPIGGAQTAWLEKTLQAREDFPTVFVYNHVPAYPSHRKFTGNENAAIRKHWVPLFERYNVDAVMEHHDHTYKRTHPLLDGLVNANGVPYLGDGSWGMIRPVAKPEERPYLAVADEAYHLSVHRLEGAERFHVALSDTGRVVDITTTKKRSRKGVK